MTKQNGTSKPTDKPRRWRRRLLFAVPVAVVVLGLLTALLPTMASTRMGTNVVQSFVNGSIAGSVRIDDLDVAWSKGQRVTGLTLFDPDGAVALTVEKIAAPDLSLWSLLRGGREFGQINAEKAEGRIDQIVRAMESLESTRDVGGEQRDASEPRDLSGISVTLDIDDAQLVYAGEHIETVQISVPKAEIDIPGPGRIKLNFESQVSLVLPGSDDESPVKGTINADCTVNQLFDEQWQLQWHAAQFENSVVDITNVPVTALAVILQYTQTADAQDTFLTRLLDVKGSLDALLGPTLEARLDANGDVESLATSVSIVSDKLDIAGQLTSRAGAIIAAQQPKMRWRIDPGAWNVLRYAWPSLNDTQLVEAFDVTAQLETVNIALVDGDLRWIASALSGSAKVNDIQLRAAEPVGDIELKNTRLDLRARQLGEQIDVGFSTVAVQSDHRGRIEAGVVVKNAADAESKLSFASADITVNSRFKDVPTALIDQFVPRSEGLAESAIGQTVDMVVSARRSPQAGDVLPAWQYHCRVTADHLNASVDGRVSESYFTADTGSVDLTPEPQFTGQLVQVLADSESVSIDHAVDAEPMRIHIDVNDLVVQQKGFDTGAFSGTLKVTIDDIATAAVEHFVPRTEGLSHLAMGPTVNVSLSVEGNGQSDAADARPKYSATVTADHIKIKSEGAVDQTGLSKSHATASWTLSPELVSNIRSRYADELGEDWKNLSLKGPAQVSVSVTDFALPFEPFTLDATSGRATIEIQQVEPTGVPALKDIVLRHLRAELSIASVTKSASFTSKAYLLHGRKAAELNASGSVSRPFEAERTVEATTTGDALSLALIEQLIGRPGWLQPLLSEQIDHLKIAARNETAHPDRWSFDATARSQDRLSAQLKGVYSPGRSLIVTEGSHVELVVTPQAYAAWTAQTPNKSRDDRDFNLVEPAQLKLDVRRVQLGFKHGEPGNDANLAGLDLAAMAIDSELSVPKAEFAYRLGDEEQRLSLHNVKMTIASAMLQKGATLKLDGSVQTVDPVTGDRETSPLRSTTELTNLLDQQGNFSVAALRARTDTHLTKVPMPLIDQLAGTDGTLSAAIGPVAQLSATGDSPGKLALILKSETADLSLPLEIDQNRQVALNDDVRASLTLTEESASALFGQIHPALRDAVASTEPIRLTVKKEPFNLPLQQLSKNLDKVELDATLEIGTLQMRRRGWLSEGLNDLTSFAANIAKLARRSVGRRDQVDTYDAQFTPMRIEIRQGKLVLSEMWMVSQDMAVGFQGGANLIDQRYRFTMGVLGASLIAEEPLLAEIIDPTNIYDVPITGKIGGEPTIDKKEYELALLGSTLKQQVGRAGEEFKILVDVFGRPIQDSRRKKAGLKWNMPPEAKDFLDSVTKKSGNRPKDEKEGQGKDSAPVEPEESGEKLRDDKIGDLLNDIFR